MTIHHLNCGSLRGRFPRVDSMIYCLLVETGDGLLLVDSGLGTQDHLNPSRLMRIFKDWVGVKDDIEETAAHQVVKMGYSREDVRHIVLTHLHLDHTGGLPDFPGAQVHIGRTEYETGLNPRGLSARAYDHSHWAHDPHWVVYDDYDSDWYGFRSQRVLKGVSPEIRLIPLPGHTRGHCGVVVRTPQGWLLQAGDAASPLHPESDIHRWDQRNHTAGILPAWFVRLFLGNHVSRLSELLRVHGDEIEAVSAHDIYSFRAHQRAAK